ncbi:MAG: N-acetylneuraminate synthase family protein [Candidatus Omnitrophica bacterium]|nr:N-acetylneuraminate synthase family protein [Candidatus Omnitrophota bacterium]
MDRLWWSDAHAYCVAEVASSHEGREELAVRLAQAAAQAGADAVKFQLFRADELAVSHHPKADAFRQIEFSPDAWERIITAAKATGIHVWADVYDAPSLELAERLGLDGYKVTTTIAGDPALLPALGATGKPLLLAVGGEREDEIAALIAQVGRPRGDGLALVHGFQGFPTRLEDTHLHRLAWLRARFGLPVGFADHCPGDSPAAVILPAVAVGMGARIIEKHLTPDRAAKGRDHVSALNPDEFARMVGAIRDVERALGGTEPAPSEAEARYRQTMQKRVVARTAISAGDLLGPRHLALKRTPDAGIGPEFLTQVLGKKARQALPQEAAIRPEHVAEPVTLILVAVRMNSTRLPTKALIPLAGKPVLAHLVERVLRSRRAAKVVICTSTHPDDRVLLEWAQRLGVGGYAGSEDDVMDRFLTVAGREGADLVVRVTGDNPLTDPEAIDAMLACHGEQGADYTYTDTLPRGTRAEVLTVAALRRAHEWAEDPRHSEYMSLYFRDYPELFTIARWDAPEPLRRPHYRLTLDTPEDLEVVRRIYETLYRDGEVFPLSAAVALLDRHPEWAAINAHVAQKLPAGLNTRLRASAQSIR